MKVYQLSKKLLNRLAKELDAEIYRLCYRKKWVPCLEGGYAGSYKGKYEYVHVHQMDYECHSKYSEVKLVKRDGKTLIFNLGQKLEILGKYVSPDFFVDWFVHPLPIFSEEN